MSGSQSIEFDQKGFIGVKQLDKGNKKYQTYTSHENETITN